MTAETYTATVPYISCPPGPAGQGARVTLPKPPFALEAHDRRDTEPRTLAIRGKHTWRDDPVLTKAERRARG